MENKAVIFADAPYRKRIIIYILLGLCCSLYLYPYIVNHYYIEAHAHSDDGMYAYYTVQHHSPNFSGDVFQAVHTFFINSSLTYFGTFWLVDATGVPLRFIYWFLLVIMFFAMPVITVRLIKDRISTIWIPIVFLVVLLSKYYAWNLSNHNDVDFPYRADIAVPFLYGGLLLLLRNNRAGYALLTIGGLFHPAMGLFAFTTVFLMQLLRDGRPTMKDFPPLSAAAVVSLLPSVTMLFGGTYEHVPKADVMNLLLANMHFLPWESPFLWPQSVLSVTAFFILLSCCAFNTIDRLGAGYRMLLIGALLSSLLWMASQVIGLKIEAPSVIMVAGLRSVTMLSIVAMPILLLYLIDKVKNASLLQKILGTFTLAVMVIGKPYGLFVSLAVMLLACELIDKYAHSSTYRNRLTTIVAAMLVTWSFALLLSALNIDLFSGMQNRISAGLRDLFSMLQNDSAPFSIGVGATYMLPVLAAVVLASMLDKRYNVKTAPLLLIALFGLFLLADTYRFYRLSGGDRYKDLYAAQVWAKNNTADNDLFIVYEGSWRSFSERPAFVPRKLGYYMYKPDVAIKRFDDVVYEFYDIQNPYDRYSQKELLGLIQYKYNALKESDFIRLAKTVHAKYLVETKYLNLPIVYYNRSYAIYYVGG